MGGAIASGHPYSASGVALITRLLNMTHWKRELLRWGLEEEWGMRYSSNDGDCEKIEIYFNEQEVRAYCEVVERTYKGVVPLLMCKRLAKI